MARSARRHRRRAVVQVAVPAAIVAVLALVALWQVGAPHGEPGATGTIGVNPRGEATLERVPVRQLTSERTFWAGRLDDEPVFVVSERPIRVEPGDEVTIVGRLETPPTVEIARHTWQIDDATAKAVVERGVYLRAREIRAQP